MNKRCIKALPMALFGAISMLSLPGCDPGSRSSSAGAEDVACDGGCANAQTFLTISDVETIIARAVNEAQARDVNATVAVVDRVGNVLGVFRMNGADTEVTVSSGRNVGTGFDGITYIPDTLAAIAKAITAAYLSSEGSAFSTRTASQIVQQNFNPGEADQAGGPLFGVQFSNLPCSDLNTRFPADSSVGPKRSPLGLAADPGGLPLYKDGTPVGGIGVIADGVYGIDTNAMDRDLDLDELIALAGSFGYAAPSGRRADRIAVDGKTLRFVDVDFPQLATTPDQAPAFAELDGVAGDTVAVTGYTNGAIVAGAAFGQPESGIRPDTLDYPGLGAFVLVGAANNERFRPRDGTASAGSLTEDEVRQLLSSALKVANRARTQIRRPLGSSAQVTVSVVDVNGDILGMARTRDAPVFGIDVSLQKARTAAFYSSANAATELNAAPDAVYPDRDDPFDPPQAAVALGDYVTAAQNFLGLPAALTDGAYAFSDRAGGNLSRPYFPDGLIGSVNGPFSKPFAEWSPFSTGLQTDLVINEVINHVLFTLGVPVTDPTDCTNLGANLLQNGMQIFPGSVPVYRGNVLIGGIGVSGDGVDQDDMIAFLGLHEAAQTLGTINNAPASIRADNLTPQGIRLRYVQCPQAPFTGSDEQNVCDGK
jgi:uncharacterized protein GlcG (DUF336 family)